jgi:hypothetical protein
MDKPTIRVHNVTTKEIIDREMNAEELAQYESELAIKQTIQTDAQLKAEQRAALLERLGITEEEAKLLLG